MIRAPRKGFTPLEKFSLTPILKKQRRSLTGFTLIELLIVVAIIGVLSSIVMGALGTARVQSRDAKRLSDFRQILNIIGLASIDSVLTFSGAGVTCGGGSNPYIYRISSCTTPNLSAFRDPRAGAISALCNGTPIGVCHYSVRARTNGTATPTSNDFIICGYLESGTGNFSAGPIKISDQDPYPTAGACWL